MHFNNGWPLLNGICELVVNFYLPFVKRVTVQFCSSKVNECCVMICCQILRVSYPRLKMLLNILLFWLPGIFDKFILFSSTGSANVYSSYYKFLLSMEKASIFVNVSNSYTAVLHQNYNKRERE